RVDVCARCWVTIWFREKVLQIPGYETRTMSIKFTRPVLCDLVHVCNRSGRRPRYWLSCLRGGYGHRINPTERVFDRRRDRRRPTGGGICFAQRIGGFRGWSLRRASFGNVGEKDCDPRSHQWDSHSDWFLRWYSGHGGFKLLLRGRRCGRSLCRDQTDPIPVPQRTALRFYTPVIDRLLCDVLCWTFSQLRPRDR